jgi:hypothetical protein
MNARQLDPLLVDRVTRDDDVEVPSRHRVAQYSGALPGQRMVHGEDADALPWQTRSSDSSNAEVLPWTHIKCDGDDILPQEEFLNLVDLDTTPPQVWWTGSSGDAASGDETALDIAHEAVPAATAAPV